MVTTNCKHLNDSGRLYYATKYTYNFTSTNNWTQKQPNKKKSNQKENIVNSWHCNMNYLFFQLSIEGVKITKDKIANTPSYYESLKHSCSKRICFFF